MRATNGSTPNTPSARSTVSRATGSCWSKPTPTSLDSATQDFRTPARKPSSTRTASAAQIEYDVPFSAVPPRVVGNAGEPDAADMVKRMLDYGVHPPTTKWPEIVSEALMTEPTEIENRETLDEIAEAFNAVAQEDDSVLEAAPEKTTAKQSTKRVPRETCGFRARAGRVAGSTGCSFPFSQGGTWFPMTVVAIR